MVPSLAAGAGIAGIQFDPGYYKKRAALFQATRLSRAALKTHGFPFPSCGGFGFI
jgi:hypothetical protein